MIEVLGMESYDIQCRRSSFNFGHFFQKKILEVQGPVEERKAFVSF